LICIYNICLIGPLNVISGEIESRVLFVAVILLSLNLSDLVLEHFDLCHHSGYHVLHLIALLIQFIESLLVILVLVIDFERCK